MKKTKLVMTLLVRDEGDILENNICFHLAHGVDFIVAVDNASIDKTPKILEKYSKKGLLHFWTVKEHTFEQSKWVASMAKVAIQQFGATHLMHSDADEFWFPQSGNLKIPLPQINQVFYVPTINYLPPSNILKTTLGIRTVVVNSIKGHRDARKLESSKYLLYGGYPKIITSANFTKVIQGNHDVKGARNFGSKIITEVLIHHFPIRSYRQFEKKVSSGGAAYANNPNKNPQIGWHWKAWYKLYLAGKLKQEYQKIRLSRSDKAGLKKTGIIKDIFIPNKILLAKYFYQFQKRKKLLNKLSKRAKLTLWPLSFS